MSILKVKDKDGKFVDIPVISGRPASIRVGEVKLLEPNSEPTIENVGTEYDAIFDFGIPKGEYIVQGEDFRLDLSDYAKQKQLDKEIQNRQQTDNNLQSQIKSLASGSPKGVYNDATALKNANPDTGVYITSDNGHIYSWNKNSEEPIDLGVYQATEIGDGEITNNKLANKSVSIDKIDFNVCYFTDYEVVRKKLTGHNTSTFQPTWREDDGVEYYAVDFEIPNNINYLSYPFTEVGTFGIYQYSESKAYGFTNSNIKKNAHSELKYENGIVTIDLKKILKNGFTHLAIQMHPDNHYLKLDTKDGSDINIPLTSFIGESNLKNESISNEKIKDGAVSFEKCSDDLKKAIINGILDKTIITVKQDGTGDFVTLNEALSSLEENKKYEIQIHEGTYNVSDYWTEEQLNNSNYPNGFYGEIIPNNCDLVGIGNRDNIIIHGELAETVDWNTIRNQISTLNIEGNATIKNVTVSAKSLRYVIHDDFSSSENTIHNYINCKIIYYTDRIRHAFGSGARNGLIINIEDCVIEPAIGYHTNVGFTKAPILNIKNTIIKGNLQLTDYNSGIECPVNLENVKYSYLTYSKFNNTTQYIKLNSLGNSITPIIYNTDFNFSSEETVKVLSNDNVTRGQILKRVDCDIVTPLLPNDDVSLFYGVAVENISKYVYNSNRHFGNVQTKWYINTSLIGLSNFNIGDKIGIINGVFGVVNNNPVGIIEFIKDNIGYIRLFN